MFVSLGVSETVKFVATTLGQDSVLSAKICQKIRFFHLFHYPITQSPRKVPYSQRIRTLSMPGYGFDRFRGTEIA